MWIKSSLHSRTWLVKCTVQRANVHEELLPVELGSGKVSSVTPSIPECELATQEYDWHGLEWGEWKLQTASARDLPETYLPSQTDWRRKRRDFGVLKWRDIANGRTRATQASAGAAATVSETSVLTLDFTAQSAAYPEAHITVYLHTYRKQTHQSVFILHWLYEERYTKHDPWCSNASRTRSQCSLKRCSGIWRQFWAQTGWCEVQSQSGLQYMNNWGATVQVLCFHFMSFQWIESFRNSAAWSQFRSVEGKRSATFFVDVMFKKWWSC